ncbi:MAG: DNA starvation/stationary phase protection protein [Oligoflexia bacterium]|nr:DNA starvation/stationary phase protection protein [Oligoflexia bacterium]
MRKETESTPARSPALENGASAIDRELATPTDLSSKERTAVTEAVNVLLADSLALYLKTKNFHWHLSGPRFRDYHLLFDEQAEQILESVDVLAERVRKIGGTTIRSISHVGDLQTIEDDNDSFVEADAMIERLLADNRSMASAIREAIEICDDNRDSPTGNILQETLDQTERRVWFLFEISRRTKSAA